MDKSLAISSNKTVVLVRGEDDITWSPLVPEIVLYFNKLQLKFSILDVSEFSIPKFVKPAPWAIEKYDLRSGNRETEKLMGDLKVDYLSIHDEPANEIIPENDLSKMEGSVSSLLMTLFSDPTPTRHRILQPIFKKKALAAAKSLYLRSYGKFSRLTNLVVVLPNGRFPYQKAIELAAKRANAEVLYYERGFRPEAGFFLDSHTTQDRRAWQEKAKKIQDKSVKSEAINDAVAWLEQRRIPSSKTNEFASFWSKGKSPSASKKSFPRNSVAFFTSSKDEYLALEGWEGFGWEDQYEAFLEFSANVVGPKVLRVHPNFVNKSFQSALSELRRILWFLRRAKETRIVWPTDQVNSYEIIDNSERIFVHGSTVGLESSSIGKSVWNSGNSVYDTHADVRRFEPLQEYERDYFTPWKVEQKRSLEIVQAMINSDFPFSESGRIPQWNASTIPFFIRVSNLILAGSIPYLLVLVKKSLSIRANRLLISISRLIMRHRKFT